MIAICQACKHPEIGIKDYFKCSYKGHKKSDLDWGTFTQNWDSLSGSKQTVPQTNALFQYTCYRKKKEMCINWWCPPSCILIFSYTKQFETREMSF